MDLILIVLAALGGIVGGLLGGLAANHYLAGYAHRCPDCEMPRDLCECGE